MKLRETIAATHSKANTTRIVNWIGKDQQRFDQLFSIFLNDEHRIVQRAAWPLSYAVIVNPRLIQKHFGKLIKNLQKPGIHDAVKRNTVRLLQDIDIPEKYHGEIMNICFEYISSPDEATAIKAFSLTILHNLSKKYPEIKQEMKAVVEDRWEYETIAFRNRAKKVLGFGF